VPEQTLDYDIVIVGSGAGGGTAAKALSDLAAAGAKIALVDWGGHFRKQDNTRRELEMAQKYYFDAGGFQTASQDMTLAFARAIGGTTNVYTGVTFELPQHALDKWGVDALSLDDLKPRMEHYAAENNVHLQPPEKINTNNDLFAEACRKLGWELGQFPLNIKGCAGLNTCNLGCARHAKQGTAQVQIPAAEAQGVEVLPFCRIDRIDGHELHAEVVPAEHGLAQGPLQPGRYRLRARKIVLAAGAMNTPPLLMRSFDDWERRWPALGRYFTCHPALTLIAEHEQPVEGSIGHPKSYYCDEFVEREKFLLETCFYFPFITAKNLAGFGPEVDALMQRMDHQQQILVLMLDEARRHNRITIDKAGNPVCHYELSDDIIAALTKAIRASGRIFFAAGAKRAHLPAAGKFFTYREEAAKLDTLVTEDKFKLGQIAITAAHLMGGCRMGDTAHEAVTDPWGRIYGLDDVYVADASLFPGSAEVNPYLTIMALADRVAEAVRHDLNVAAG